MAIKNKYLKEFIEEFEKSYKISYDEIPKLILDESKIKDSWKEVLYTFFNIINYQDFLIKVVNKDNFKYITKFEYEVKHDNTRSK